MLCAGGGFFGGRMRKIDKLLTATEEIIDKKLNAMAYIGYSWIDWGYYALIIYDIPNKGCKFKKAYQNYEEMEEGIYSVESNFNVRLNISYGLPDKLFWDPPGPFPGLPRPFSKGGDEDDAIQIKNEEPGGRAKEFVARFKYVNQWRNRPKDSECHNLRRKQRSSKYPCGCPRKEN